MSTDPPSRSRDTYYNPGTPEDPSQKEAAGTGSTEGAEHARPRELEGRDVLSMILTMELIYYNKF